MSAGNGGPAFPLPHDVALVAGLQVACGMTLRDYFAAKSMQAMLTRPGSIDGKFLADFAYVIADAMLKAREVAV